jgi:HPt (histidine-containing phosphotransfer) domain-containing protein
MKKEFEELLFDLGVDIPTTLARLSNNAVLLERVMLKFTNTNQLPQLIKAVEDEDYPTAEQVAHTIKGVSGNLGLVGLYDICDDFVQDIRQEAYDQAKAKIMGLQEEYSRVFGLITAYQD